MTGELTYHQARPKGFDPINDPVDWLLDCLPEVSFETVLQIKKAFCGREEVQAAMKQRFLNQKLGKRNSRRVRLQKAKNLFRKPPGPRRTPGRD